MIAVDLFAGAGGCSTGLLQAATKSGVRVDLTAVDTVTSRDRFGLVQPVINGRVLDIRFRMLQPHELAAAMSFPPGYQFTGTKTEITKQIGNAVVCVVAEALCGAMLDGASDRPSRRTEVA